MENNGATVIEKIIKKEDKLIYKKGTFRTDIGTLTLTPDELYFLSKNQKKFSIPTKEIISVNCKKAIGAGTDDMIVIYREVGQEKRVMIRHVYYLSVGLGAAARIAPSYFISWGRSNNAVRLPRCDLASAAKDRPVSFYTLSTLCRTFPA